MAAEEHQPASPAGDCLVGHEPQFVQCREARGDVRLGRRGHRSAPRDLEGHPHRLATRCLHHLLGHIADDADVAIGEIGVLAGGIGDRKDVGARDVESRSVRHQLGHRATRGLDDDDRMTRVERLELSGSAHETVGSDPVVATEGVARLVDPLVRRERSVILHRAHDPLEQLLADRGRSGRALGKVREITEIQPAVEPVRSGCIQSGAF